MVKFSKELEAQLIPEWKDYFVNYWQLKKQVKKIKRSRKPKLVSQVQNNNSSFGYSVFDPVRSLLSTISSKLHCSSSSSSSGDNDEAGKDKSTEEDDDQEELHEFIDTELSQLFSEEEEVNIFFEKLDEELEKVNHFYRARETEFLLRGEALLDQLKILIDLKQVINQRRRKNFTSPLSSFHGGFLSRSNSSSTRNSDCSENMSETNVATDASSQTDEVLAAFEKNGINFIGAATMAKIKKGKPKMALRIDIPAITPTRTISAFTNMLWEDLVNNSSKDRPRELINRKKVQCAEKMIRRAFVELYRGLGLLKTYSSLNMVAFTKILKKFDKVANRQASCSYLKTVKSSHFISSDKVVRLMDEVESLFTKHFTDNDRKKAMKFLRPQQQRDSHMVTFFVGLFTGCFVTLFVVYAILAHISGLFSRGSIIDGSGYMETVYPLFSTFALLGLHLFMYGCNMLTWKATRINYTFIFEFNPKTALKYRDAFLVCTSLMTAVVGALVIHLILRSSSFPAQQVDVIPGILLLIFFAMLICPLNVLYRPTRYSFLKVMRNIVFSPLYKVLMVDFFMADQLTSQIPLLRHMETTACYFMATSLGTRHYDVCKKGKLYRELAYVISFAPYYWRAMQCARRWFDESDAKQLANLGKYVSAMIAAGARLTYAQQQEPTVFCTILVVATSVVATVYQLYWDFVQDWGFFDLSSKNQWLRDELVLKNKFIYYISIVINLILRVAWVESVMRFRKVRNVEAKFFDFSLASLEVIRRGHWNFYRLENEHLNNVGKYRAVITVPLPFRETDSDG